MASVELRLQKLEEDLKIRRILLRIEALEKEQKQLRELQARPIQVDSNLSNSESQSDSSSQQLHRQPTDQPDQSVQENELTNPAIEQNESTLEVETAATNQRFSSAERTSPESEVEVDVVPVSQFDSSSYVYLKSTGTTWITERGDDHREVLPKGRDRDAAVQQEAVHQEPLRKLIARKSIVSRASARIVLGHCLVDRRVIDRSAVPKVAVRRERVLKEPVQGEVTRRGVVRKRKRGRPPRRPDRNSSEPNESHLNPFVLHSFAIVRWHPSSIRSSGTRPSYLSVESPIVSVRSNSSLTKKLLTGKVFPRKPFVAMSEGEKTISSSRSLASG